MNKDHKTRLTRQSANYASRREAILDAAEKSFDTEGRAGLALRAVASLAGYVPAALYAYFPTKQVLTRALATRRLGALSRQIKTAAQQAGALKKTGPAAILGAAAQEGLNALRTDPGLCFLLGAFLPTTASHETSDAADHMQAEEQRSLTGRFIALLETLAQPLRELAGPAQREEANHAAVTLSATILGLALIDSAGRLDALGVEAKTLCDDAVQNATRGLGANRKG